MGAAATAANVRAKRGRTQTRARMLDAAEELIDSRGLSLTIDEVCHRAGFTRGAFYSNFKTIPDMLFAIYERRTGELLDRLARGEPITATATARPLSELVEHLMEAVPADANWYSLRASFARHGSDNPQIAAALRDHGEAMRVGVTPFCDAVVAAAGRHYVIDPADAVRSLIAANVGAVLNGPLVDDADALRRNTILATLRGITAANHDRTSANGADG